MITVDPKAIHIASVYTAVKDVRFYLRGIYFQPDKTGITLTATDGHQLIQVHDKNGTCDKPVILELTKPAISALTKAETVSFEQMNGLDWVLITDTQRHKIRAIDAKYPDVGAVLPSRPPLLSCLAKTFDASLLASLHVASKILSNKKLFHKVTLWPGAPNSPAYAEFGTDNLQCKVVIMPLQSDNADCNTATVTYTEKAT